VQSWRRARSQPRQASDKEGTGAQERYFTVSISRRRCTTGIAYEIPEG